jgi:hypothetical protein
MYAAERVSGRSSGNVLTDVMKASSGGGKPSLVNVGTIRAAGASANPASIAAASFTLVHWSSHTTQKPRCWADDRARVKQEMGQRFADWRKGSGHNGLEETRGTMTWVEGRDSHLTGSGRHYPWGR